MNDETINKYYTEKVQSGLTGDTGRVGGSGLNTAQQQIAADAITTGAGIVSSGIQGGLQMSLSKDLQKQARGLYETELSDKIDQNQINNTLRKKMVSQEKRAFSLQKKKEEFDLRFNRWLDKIQKATEGRQKLVESSSNIFNTLNQDNIRNLLLKSFG